MCDSGFLVSCFPFSAYCTCRLITSKCFETIFLNVDVRNKLLGICNVEGRAGKENKRKDDGKDDWRGRAAAAAALTGSTFLR